MAVDEGAAAAVQVGDGATVVGVMLDSAVGATVEAIVGTRVRNGVKVPLGVCVGVGGNMAVAGTGVGNAGCVGTSVVVGNRTGVTSVVDEEHAVRAIAKIASIANVRGNTLGIALLLAERLRETQLIFQDASKTTGVIIAYLKEVDKGSKIGTQKSLTIRQSNAIIESLFSSNPTAVMSAADWAMFGCRFASTA